MSDNLHKTPSESFPGDLSNMPDEDLQVLDSQIQRQMDREIVREGEVNRETEFRHYQLDEEFSDRDGAEQHNNLAGYTALLYTLPTEGFQYR